MKTVDLANGGATIEHILSLAEHQSVLVRSADGKAFFVTEVSAQETDDEDFAHEVALTRTNAALRDVLRERSGEPSAFSLNEVRDKLGLS
ncbi:MAG TPA: hypothetical protein VJ783_06025 [Pirellulales bacterium]|nr:hypothetical protein [Pirellulales bacterium]